MRLFDILIMCNFKHWFRKPLQLFFLFLGISLATTLWSSIQLINTQAKKAYKQIYQRIKFPILKAEYL